MGLRLEDAVDHVADLLDRLRLDEQARSRGAVIVEGPMDATFITDVFADEGVSTFPVSGRNNVLRAADRLGLAYIRGVLCVADSDFDSEVDARAEQWFLVFTDNADVEMMIALSDALDRTVVMWGTQSKITSFGGLDRLRETLVETLQGLAVLRRQNAISNHGIPFDALNLHDVIATSTLALNIDGLVDRLARASPLSQTQIRTLLAEEPPECSHTGLPLLHGRDYLTAVDIALRRMVGNCSAQEVKSGLARKSVFLAVRPSDIVGMPFAERFLTALARSRAADTA